MTVINTKMREIKQNPLLSDEYIKSQKYMEPSYRFDANLILAAGFLVFVCGAIALHALAFWSVLTATVHLLLGD